jgi:hypothetical protein
MMDGKQWTGLLIHQIVLACLWLTTRLPGQEVIPRLDHNRPFRIEVVDDETGRGVPLVELRTVNQIRFVTDSNGIVAFDEPGLMGLSVFFHVKSHGYEFPRDGFGNCGVALEIRPGGRTRIKIHRINIARRLYRMTGGGIYRDSLLTGTPVPTAEPVLNGQVLGQDSVVTAIFEGKLFWFWGDTNRPGYPLGNFHVPGATSELPWKGGLDPSRGVNLSYFVNQEGFARPTCEMPGPGPTWISGLVVLRDRQGKERMFAHYVKIRPPLETYQRGLVEFDSGKRTFQKRAECSMDPAAHPGEFPAGHTFLKREERGIEYIYYCSPYPLVRIPADPESLEDPDAYEAFTCLLTGTRFDQQKLDRAPDGSLRYGWKKRTQLVSQQQQGKLVQAGLMKREETLLNLRDVQSGKAVLAHGGSVYWNAYRRRWVMIAVEALGTSFLGEVWYAEADTPVGPWVYARKIVTHDDYTFYNPKHHPMFDQEGGSLIYIEGTYTSTFSGNKDPTPRYDYNQVMYQLDLADPRLALPVPIYQDLSASTRTVPRTGWNQSLHSQDIAFFAPDRPGIATIPVRVARRNHTGEVLSVGEREAGEVVFYILPTGIEKSPPGTVPLYEFRNQGGAGIYLGTDEQAAIPGYRKNPKPVGRVWTNPSRLKMG